MFYGARASIGWFAAYVVLTLGAHLAGTEPAALWHAENLLLFSCVVYVLLRHFVAERGRMQAELARQHELLRQEQAKSERLLLNILPAPIAERLKQDSGIIADAFGDVTVLFADIVGFTELSARTPPGALVGLLNDLFSRFDELSARYGAEKIKTIGDAYMVCAGLPVERPDHADAIAALALDMQQAMAAFNAEHGTTLEVRIGINSGPVVAGVIGLRKFIYDLWGDTVNTASRMESHGMPGTIQVTEETYRRLRGRYAFEARGTIAVKGKGDTRTYFLVAQA
jgi:class 3 adenylate cyclase